MCGECGWSACALAPDCPGGGVQGNRHGASSEKEALTHKQTCKILGPADSCCYTKARELSLTACRSPRAPAAVRFNQSRSLCHNSLSRPGDCFGNYDFMLQFPHLTLALGLLRTFQTQPNIGTDGFRWSVAQAPERAPWHPVSGLKPAHGVFGIAAAARFPLDQVSRPILCRGNG